MTLISSKFKLYPKYIKIILGIRRIFFCLHAYKYLCLCLFELCILTYMAYFCLLKKNFQFHGPQCYENHLFFSNLCYLNKIHTNCMHIYLCFCSGKNCRWCISVFKLQFITWLLIWGTSRCTRYTKISHWEKKKKNHLLMIIKHYI